MGSQSGSGKTDTIVKVVLVFFISLLAFSVGTFVGKQVSDSDHRRVALESDAHGERTIASTEEAGGEKISEKDVENLTEEFVAQEKSSGSHDAASTAGEHSDHKEEKAEEGGYKSYNRKGSKSEEHSEETEASVSKSEKKEEHKAVAKRDDKTHAIAEKVAEGHAPTDGKAEERKPSSVLPSVATSAVGKFTVQVASYPEEKEAKTHAADLKTKGWTAFYLPAKVGGRTYYRVSVGLFDSNKAALAFRTQFMKESGAKTPPIVQKIVQ